MNIFGGLFGKSRGASEAKILEAESIAEMKFPADYRDFMRESDGFLFKKQAVKILSLEESLAYFRNMREFGITQTWGYFPMVDNEDSNPWCLCCKPPLAGYIVQVMHDDSAKIKFRNIKSFFSAIESSDRDDAMVLDDLQGDFQSSNRTAEDIEVARALLNNISNYHDVDRNDAGLFGMWLLGEEQVDEIASLLEDSDFFVVRDAIERLQVMKNPKALQALNTFRKNVNSFAEKSLELLKGAGVGATIERGSLIRLQSTDVVLEMRAFYAERNLPGAEEKFLNLAKVRAASKG